MSKYLLICPYFGKLPGNFQLWLDSCAYNTKIDFIVFTDDRTEFKIPQNVKIIYLQFKHIQEIIRKKFSFVKNDIKPYKLCDFKPTYGYLFSNYVSGYDYWGNCDVDLIYGDLAKFLPPDPYDKISNLGHTTFYRNNELINMAFMKNNKNSLTYQEILASNANFGFDEIGNYGIKQIFIRNKYSIFPLEKDIADISPNNSNLRLSHYDSKKDCFYEDKFDSILSFEKGHVFTWKLSVKGVIEKKEVAYVHFQKRKMIDYRRYKKNQRFLIGAHGFHDYQGITQELLESFHGRNIDKELIYRKFKALKNRIKREAAIRKLMKGRM
ncbi:DUF6625 family protein [uncultured Megasphaera sp.]|uniref:DUF6625 family protein n=1 Tax=uncultured Megasphaera sp. TaxID=165188 RepID=UPI00261B538F|nr:DUF6625 family protein [uncultured Megasphaera sp.]